MTESQIKVESKTYIPDLVFLRGDQAVVINPTVAWENSANSLCAKLLSGQI